MIKRHTGLPVQCTGVLGLWCFIPACAWRHFKAEKAVLRFLGTLATVASVSCIGQEFVRPWELFQRDAGSHHGQKLRSLVPRDPYPNTVPSHIFSNLRVVSYRATSRHIAPHRITSHGHPAQHNTARHKTT